MKIVYSQGAVMPEEVIQYLTLTGQANTVLSEVIKNKEVVKKARELNIEVSTEQLQHFADQYRSLRSLHTAEGMIAFLEKAGLSEDDFEMFCEASLLTAALKDHFASSTKVEEYFASHRSDFDSARVALLVVKDENLARELILRVTEDGEDFHLLARKHSLDDATKYAGGYAGTIVRQMFPPDVSARIFTAKSGDILGPLQQGDLQQLIFIEEVMSATLNDVVREAIQERIFQEWLAQFLADEIHISLE